MNNFILIPVNKTVMGGCKEICYNYNTSTTLMEENRDRSYFLFFCYFTCLFYKLVHAGGRHSECHYNLSS